MVQAIYKIFQSGQASAQTGAPTQDEENYSWEFKIAIGLFGLSQPFIYLFWKYMRYRIHRAALRQRSEREIAAREQETAEMMDQAGMKKATGSGPEAPLAPPRMHTKSAIAGETLSALPLAPLSETTRHRSSGPISGTHDSRLMTESQVKRLFVPSSLLPTHTNTIATTPMSQIDIKAQSVSRLISSAQITPNQGKIVSGKSFKKANSIGGPPEFAAALSMAPGSSTLRSLKVMQSPLSNSPLPGTRPSHVAIASSFTSHRVFSPHSSRPSPQNQNQNQNQHQNRNFTNQSDNRKTH